MRPERAVWGYKPTIPVQVAPWFRWPPQLGAIARWTWFTWNPLSERTLLVVLAWVSWRWLQPGPEVARQLEVGWIGAMYLRNLGLMILVAGGLHLYFYRRKGQGEKLRYDPRDLRRSSRLFTFSNQVCDNVFWTLVSGVAFWTAYEVLMLWAQANGRVPTMAWSEHPVWFVVVLWATPVWISFHFYWVHRWLHQPRLYRLAHALHHRNTNVGPWSGLSMHPLEHLVFFSSVLVHLVVPTHPLHILFHMQHQSLTAATSHTGYEALLVKDRKLIALGTFHHQMHHRYFECNYGNLEVPWDTWFGSFHDGTDEAHERMMERRRRVSVR